MDAELRKAVDAVKAEVLSGIGEVRRQNKIVPVSGQRHTLPLPGREIDMVYYPARRKNAPLILGFHGGGFLFGGCAMDDAMWTAMRDQLDMNIASIDYRKTPEHMFPAPVEDAYDSAIYLKNHAAEFGFDPKQISVFGNSAGANISAAVCLYAKEKGGVQFDYQILNYPTVDCNTLPEIKGKGSLDGPISYVFMELYVKPEDSKNIFCSPIFATKEQLQGLPTAIIYTADNDTLKKEGEAYAMRLQEAGVTVHLSCAKGMPHGYYEYGFGTSMGQDFLDDSVKHLIESGEIAKAARECLAYIKKWLKEN